MADKSSIEWTDATWNPIRGCSRVSEGCRNCYAEGVAYRFSGPGKPFEGLVQIGADGNRRARWNGSIVFVEEHLLDPLKWRKPRRIFVNSMSDLFHENVTDEMLDRIFAVMALCPQHTFQVLTKRPERMLKYLTAEVGFRIQKRISRWAHDGVVFKHLSHKESYRRTDAAIIGVKEGPLPNVWLGVSVEDQKAADERIPLLLKVPAAVRFISAEPLLGAIDLSCKEFRLMPSLEGRTKQVIGTYLERFPVSSMPPYSESRREIVGAALDWVICGGESGPSARPMHPDWARGLRDQCVAAGVPFFFKQWGEWGWEPVYWSATPELAGTVYGPFRPTCVGPGGDYRMMCRAYPAVIPGEIGKDDRSFVWIHNGHRVGKTAAGDLLDGVQWHQYPAVTA